ncbi:MAG TPA: SIS domain-containing protein [Terriglobales bacterium]
MSDSVATKAPGDGKTPPQRGAHSLSEILSQPRCWEACLAEIEKNHSIAEITKTFAHAPEWLFIGCGSSYYVALAAAATMKALTGRSARAVPASEILLYPELVFSNEFCVAVLISRSGQTSEVLKAAQVLRERDISSIAVTCVKGQELERLAGTTIVLPADEKSTVMTRSFTSMLLALQYLAGRIAASQAFCESLAAMPAMCQKRISPMQEQVREFVERHQFADYVALAQGPLYGLSCEYALKVTEMSVSYAQFFHSLEFRHGPKSIVSPETLIIFLLSEQGYEAEVDLLREVKSLGGTTMVITDKAEEPVRASSDLLIELPLDLPELARVAPFLVPGQLLGLYTGLKKGLDPDSPRNLSRAVVLGDQPESKHAAL